MGVNVGPKLWSVLPVHVRKELNTEVFKRQAKTILSKNSEEFIRYAHKYDWFNLLIALLSRDEVTVEYALLVDSNSV